MTSHSNWQRKATQGKSNRRSKRKVESEIAPTSDPKEAVCFYCNTNGHWKRSCPKYIKDLKDGKAQSEVLKMKVSKSVQLQQLYGLKQASRSWNLCFHEKVIQFGFLEAKMSPVYMSKLVGKMFRYERFGDAAYILVISRNPAKVHWTLVKEYSYGISKKVLKTRFLVYGGEKELKVTGYCDAGWQTDKDDSRSQSGWVSSLNWERDNEQVKSKIHKVEEGHVIVKDIRLEDNPADPFTKALLKSKHDEHSKSIGLKDKIDSAVALDGTICLVDEDKVRPIIVDDLSKCETVGFSVQVHN
ncbi:retrotransposon protein, putative, ty1-copia subclass [Tanacetum coccineum]